MAMETLRIVPCFVMMIAVVISIRSNNNNNVSVGVGAAAATGMGLSSDSNLTSVTAMYVLGDSSVDCGDNSPFYSLLHRNFSLFPCNGSDSTLLPQLLAKKMGLPHTIPFYSQNGSIHDVLSGVNFGSAEATILYSRSYQSLNQQLRQAFDTIQLLHLHLGEDIADHYLRSSLFYISFGKDDFINYFLHNSSGISRKYSGQNFTHILVRQMTNALRNLHAFNVRKIVVVGVLPLGCAPRLLLKWDNGTSSSERNGCFDEVNLLVQEYNTRLEEKIVDMNRELPGAHFVYCDVYRAMMQFISNHTAYGLKDVKNACCGVGKYGGVSGCVSVDMACPHPSSHVWWDLYNPTPAVNSLLANSSWSGHPLSAICRPITVQQLLSSSH